MERNQKDVLKADGKVQKYETPPILDGYKYVSGKWNNGFIIERIQDESQFVWIPVGGEILMAHLMEVRLQKNLEEEIIRKTNFQK